MSTSQSVDVGVTDFEHLPLMLTVEETARVLRIGRNSAYEAVAGGSIPSIRIGRKIRVPRRALAAWIEDRDEHWSFEPSPVSEASYATRGPTANSGSGDEG